ncbi:MAG: hypothetical protein NZ750_03120 [Anaerolineae bacterium]|nr:hypothetical protein [Anaerolineae bacterium]MDW8170958.1 hypothetical protein [Anaerolineae bacterium]
MGLFSWFRRSGDSSNTVIGIILLIVMLVFVGPNVIPGLLSRTFNFIDEGIPCTRLRTAEDRAAHQSLIGRLAQNPISLRVIPDTIPPFGSGSGMTFRIVISNETIGTVPIVFNEAQVIVNDDPNSSGFGLIFEPALPITTGGVRQPGLATFPEANIRLLGPRQRCVHRVDFRADQVDAAFRSVPVRVRAYYRVTGPGIIQSGVPGSRLIYGDQGLNIIRNGFLTSDPVLVPTPSQ